MQSGFVMEEVSVGIASLHVAPPSDAQEAPDRDGAPADPLHVLEVSAVYQGSPEGEHGKITPVRAAAGPPHQGEIEEPSDG